MPWPAMIRSSSIWRDDRQTALRGDAIGDPLALVARGPDDDDLGAIGHDALALDRRCVDGHDDDGRDAEHPRGAGHALGVVAGGVGDDAARDRSAGSSVAIVAYAPRSLNAPIGWSDSAFRNRRSPGARTGPAASGR